MRNYRHSHKLRLLFRNTLVSFLVSFFMSEVALAKTVLDFEVGSSCATLAFADPDALLWLVESLSGDELDEFCFPEEPFICSDYSDQIEEMGKIRRSTNQEGMCALKSAG